MQAYAAAVKRPGAEENRARLEAGRRKQRHAAADEFGDDVNLDFVQRAAFQKRHLQLAAAEHPYIAVIERAQFRNQRIDVMAGFKRPLGFSTGRDVTTMHLWSP